MVMACDSVVVVPCSTDHSVLSPMDHLYCQGQERDQSKLSKPCRYRDGVATDVRDGTWLEMTVFFLIGLAEDKCYTIIMMLDHG